MSLHANHKPNMSGSSQELRFKFLMYKSTKLSRDQRAGAASTRDGGAIQLGHIKTKARTEQQETTADVFSRNVGPTE